MNVSSEYFGVSVRMPLQKEKYFENYVSHTCIFPLSTMLLQHTSLKKDIWLTTDTTHRIYACLGNIVLERLPKFKTLMFNNSISSVRSSRFFFFLSLLFSQLQRVLSLKLHGHVFI